MKKSEEINLSEQMNDIDKYIKRNNTLDVFYDRIGGLSLLSIQDLSFEKDIALFKELMFILAVISSIIAKPHINNKREQIIARNGEVSVIEEEDFQKTLKDSSLWKDQGNGILIPEYVYYHQYEDELKIYENIFIVHMINEISTLVDRYNSLYLSLLTTAKDRDELVKENSMQESALESVNRLLRRINQIKETYFYREVNRAKNKPKVFYPTNILIHDRLYNLCYKFYKKMYVYSDPIELERSLYVYYLMHIFKAFKEDGFELDARSNTSLYKNKIISLPDISYFTKGDLRIALLINETENTFILNFKDKLDNFTSSHIVKVVNDNTFMDVKIEKLDDKDMNIFTTEYLSLWHLGEKINNRIVIENETLLNEHDLVLNFLHKHHYVIEGSEKLYSRYCPNCKNKNLHFIDGYYNCPDCGSIYKFVVGRNSKTTNKIVFARIRN